MKKKLLLLLLFSLIGYAQIPIDSISYNYFYKKELKEIVLLKAEIKYSEDKLHKEIALAELYKSINCEDSAYATLFRVFEREKEKQTLDSEGFNELLYELYQNASAKNNYEKNTHYFLNKIDKNINPDKWVALYYKELASIYILDSAKVKEGQLYIRKAKQTNYYKNNKEFQSIIYLNEGNLNTSIKNFIVASNLLKKGLTIAQERKDLLRQVYFCINLAVNNLQQSNFNEALNNLNTAEKIPNNKYKPKILRFIYSLKREAYLGLKSDKEVAYCDKIIQKLNLIINDFQKNSNFYEIDTKYQTKEKDAKISKLSSLEKKFIRNKIIYGFLIFLVFLLALYSFVRWKKADKRKKILAEENLKITEEVGLVKQELKAVKQVVVDDFILLKNKSKVYLSDLMYIKSEDHYLYLYTLEKREFVRGKLSETLAQLPPNFVKCHRSYIINKNYIQHFSSTGITMKNNSVIPISRNFKLDED